MISKLYYGPALDITDLLWASYDLSAFSRAGRSPPSRFSDVSEGSGIPLNRPSYRRTGDVACFQNPEEEPRSATMGRINCACRSSRADYGHHGLIQRYPPEDWTGTSSRRPRPSSSAGTDVVAVIAPGGFTCACLSRIRRSVARWSASPESSVRPPVISRRVNCRDEVEKSSSPSSSGPPNATRDSNRVRVAPHHSHRAQAS